MLEVRGAQDLFRETEEWARLEMSRAVLGSSSLEGVSGYASANVFVSLRQTPSE
jgi:hypothetical protein